MEAEHSVLLFLLPISFVAGMVVGYLDRRRRVRNHNHAELADRQSRCHEALNILLQDEIRANHFAKPHGHHYIALMDMVSSALGTKEVTVQNIDAMYIETMILALACAGLNLTSRWQRVAVTDLHPEMEWRARFYIMPIPTRSVKAMFEDTPWYSAIKHEALQSVAGVSTRFGRY